MAVPASNLAPDYQARMEEGLRLIQPTQCPTCRHREQRILEREHRVHRVHRQRRRWAGRMLILVVFAALAYVAWVRFGHDPMASVQR